MGQANGPGSRRRTRPFRTPKEPSMSSRPDPDLSDLPKAHLHVHLEGAMRPSTLSDLARHYGAPLPSPPTTFGSFADFGALYFAAAGLLRSLGDLARLVGEVVEDAASAGAVWIEPAIHLPDHHRLGEPPDGARHPA